LRLQRFNGCVSKVFGCLGNYSCGLDFGKHLRYSTFSVWPQFPVRKKMGGRGGCPCGKCGTILSGRSLEPRQRAAVLNVPPYTPP
jgi:hypothetical protein